MNKSELIVAMAERANLSKANSARALNTITDIITETLINEAGLNIIGFGSFSVKTRAARTGRNPQNGESIHIKASKAAVFKAGKTLKDRVNLNS